MARQKRKAPEPIGDPNDPQGMIVMLNKFLEALRVKNFSEQTVANREYYGKYFIRWCEDRGVMRPTEVNKPILERFQRFLFHYRKKNGEPLSFRTQSHHLVVLRVWFKWLARNNHTLYNPASEIDLPKQEYRLPKYVLTARETDQIINQADAETSVGIRDRAIMETFYSTGMGRSCRGCVGCQGVMHRGDGICTKKDALELTRKVCSVCWKAATGQSASGKAALRCAMTSAAGRCGGSVGNLAGSSGGRQIPKRAVRILLWPRSNRLQTRCQVRSPRWQSGATPNMVQEQSAPARERHVAEKQEQSQIMSPPGQEQRPSQTVPEKSVDTAKDRSLAESAQALRQAGVSSGRAANDVAPPKQTPEVAQRQSRGRGR